MKQLLTCVFVIISLSGHAQKIKATIDANNGPKLDCTQEQPLYVIDDKVISCDSLQYLKATDLEDVRFLTLEKSIELYGTKAKQLGTVVMTTKKYAQQKRDEPDKPKDNKKPG